MISRKQIPIYINNFNRFTSLKAMVDFLLQRGFHNIHILDNQSTYPPLLEWYASLREYGVIVRYMPMNYGAHTLYNSGIAESINDDLVVYTDSDLELNPLMPEDFLDIMWSKMQKYNERKAGLALRIDDIPDNAYGKTHDQVHHEEFFWQQELEPEVYKAPVDTTFCLLWRPKSHIYEAIRIGGVLTCRHLPWYQDFNHMNEEELYFVNHSNPHSNYACHYRNFVGNPM